MKNKSSLFFILKLTLVLLATWYIFEKVFFDKNFEDLKASFINIFSKKENFLLLTAVLILMLFNWGIESLKWKFLIQKIEKPGHLKSFIATISGVTTSVFTPNRVGEFVGRVFYMEESNRIQGALIAIIGSMSQLLITILCGSAALLFFLSAFKPINFLSEYLSPMLIFIILLILIILPVLYFSTATLGFFLNRFAFLKKAGKYIAVFSMYKPGELLVALLFSFSRYIVFSIQFYLLLSLFDAEIPVTMGFMLIPLVFLAATVVPTITAAELGVREFFALQFIGLASSNPAGIVLSAFSLWIINLAIPALIGSIFIMGFKTMVFQPKRSLFIKCELMVENIRACLKIVFLTTKSTKQAQSSQRK